MSVGDTALRRQLECDQQHVLGFLQWQRRLGPRALSGEELARAFRAPWPEVVAHLKQLSGKGNLPQFREECDHARQLATYDQTWNAILDWGAPWLKPELDHTAAQRVLFAALTGVPERVLDEADVQAALPIPRLLHLDLDDVPRDETGFLELAKYAATVDDRAILRVLHEVTEAKSTWRLRRGLSVSDLLKVFDLDKDRSEELEWTLEELRLNEKVEMTSEGRVTRYRSLHDRARREQGPLAVYDLFDDVDARKKLGPRAIARQLGVKPPTTHEHLDLLTDAQLLAREGKAYVLGPARPPSTLLAAAADAFQSGGKITPREIWEQVQGRNRANYKARRSGLALLGETNVFRLIEKAISHGLIAGASGAIKRSLEASDELVLAPSAWMFLRRCSKCGKCWGSRNLLLSRKHDSANRERGWAPPVHEECPTEVLKNPAAPATWFGIREYSLKLEREQDCAACDEPFHQVAVGTLEEVSGSVLHMIPELGLVNRLRELWEGWSATRLKAARSQPTGRSKDLGILLERISRANLATKKGAEEFTAAAREAAAILSASSRTHGEFLVHPPDATMMEGDGGQRAVQIRNLALRAARSATTSAPVVFRKDSFVHPHCSG